MIKKIICLILFLILIDTALGATVYGTVYDFSLNKQNNAIVEVNSTPKQLTVAKDGDYSFELPVGIYEIKARYLIGSEVQSLVTETINVENEGNFRLDLILFPSFEAEEEILNETEFEIEDLEEINYTGLIITAIVVAIGLIIFLVLKYKRILGKLRQKEEVSEVDDIKNIIDFIKKQGGRITQKEIRQNFPSSEAKISLVLTELEEKGVIKKIKRGRGNIIILK